MRERDQPSPTEIARAIRTAGNLAWYWKSIFGIGAVAAGGWAVGGVDLSWLLSIGAGDRLEAALVVAVVVLWLRLSWAEEWMRKELLSALRANSEAMSASAASDAELSDKLGELASEMGRVRSALNEPIPMPGNPSSGLVPTYAPASAKTEPMIPPPPRSLTRMHVALAVAFVFAACGCAPSPRDRAIADSAATAHAAVAYVQTLPMEQAAAAPLTAAATNCEAVVSAVGFRLGDSADIDDPKPIANPAVTPARWAAEPATAAALASAQAGKTEALAPPAPAGFPWAAICASLAGAAALVARFHPATGAIAALVGGIRDAAWTVATPAHVRLAEATTERQAAAAKAARAILKSLPPGMVADDLRNNLLEALA